MLPRCMQVRRTKDWEAEADGIDASDAPTKLFWFAPGVGMVREENEETGSFELPHRVRDPGR